MLIDDVSKWDALQLLARSLVKRKHKRSPIELRLRTLGHVRNLFAIVFAPPLAGRNRDSRGLSRLTRSRIEQIVNLFQNPPPHLQQFFPDAALVFRHEANLSHVR